MYDTSVFQRGSVDFIEKENPKIEKQISDHFEKFHDHLSNVFMIDNKNCGKRAKVQKNVKQHGAAGVYMENILKDCKMAGAADRKKFGHTLHDPEENRLYDIHDKPPVSFIPALIIAKNTCRDKRTFC